MYHLLANQGLLITVIGDVGIFHLSIAFEGPDYLGEVKKAEVKAGHTACLEQSPSFIYPFIRAVYMKTDQDFIVEHWYGHPSFWPVTGYRPTKWWTK